MQAFCQWLILLAFVPIVAMVAFGIWNAEREMQAGYEVFWVSVSVVVMLWLVLYGAGAFSLIL